LAEPLLVAVPGKHRSVRVSSEELLVEQDGPVLTVTINREHRLNSLGEVAHAALDSLWRSVKTDASVRAIIITGTGTRAFCTGMDVQETAARGGHADHEHVRTVEDFGMTPQQAKVWKPVIVAINGMCVSGGLHFVCDADVVLASTNASFFDTHTIVGQVGALEPIGLIPRIGLGNALRMVTLGRAGRLDAQDALRISLVDEVVEPDELMPRARELALVAAQNSPRAYELSKQVIWGALERPLRDALQNGWEVLRAHQSHPDCIEGVRAFVEKREPQWDVDDTAAAPN
jgi:enoyl-CoA hydratase/carnithine racemase